MTLNEFIEKIYHPDVIPYYGDVELLINGKPIESATLMVKLAPKVELNLEINEKREV